MSITLPFKKKEDGAAFIFGTGVLGKIDASHFSLFFVDLVPFWDYH
jgi:hypothetical protein